MLSQQRLDAVGTEPGPVHVGEQRCRSFRNRSLSHAWSAHRASVVSGVVRSFRPLPTHRHVCAGPEVDSIPVKASQLGEA